MPSDDDDIPLEAPFPPVDYQKTPIKLLLFTMRHSLVSSVAPLCLCRFVASFQVAPTFQSRQSWASNTVLRSTPVDEGGDKAAEKEKVGNLLADDEWTGLGIELTELVRTAVIEDLKKKSRDFLGKDEYKGTSSDHDSYLSQHGDFYVEKVSPNNSCARRYSGRLLEGIRYSR